MEMKVWIQSAFFVINVINVILGDPLKWIRSKPVTRCAGEDVKIEFVYNDTTLSFKNYTAVTWTFTSKKDQTADAIYVCYYTKTTDKFKLAKKNEARYLNRIEWVNKTFNIKLTNLSSDDSGWYNILFTVFGAGTINSRIDNSSFQLDVNDPCIKSADLSKGCTQLRCSTQKSSPKYSWSGNVTRNTTPTVNVCPKNEMNYTCCVDQQKTRCASFLVPPADQKGDKDNTALIIGIVVGCILLVIIVIAVFFYCRREDGYFAASTKDRIL